eukprot:CAMPEP_0119082000 /NCGR_PEP_ID=MMETSP1178-20130426/119386_1 /TAXON_ID=33656 /ORGANISM="unid sp, Strain CCMP2000" /LENGTH=56 /DNA_ID=CAMNT_0007064739 /DNA_START=10 /DNA_END=177 /DNA_ORIENTATION=+
MPGSTSSCMCSSSLNETGHILRPVRSALGPPFLRGCATGVSMKCWITLIDRPATVT